MIDTDVLIDAERGVLELPEARCAISVITLYEFCRGKEDPAEAKRVLEEGFKVIPLTNPVLETAAEIWREFRRSGEPIDERDLLIGATAIAEGLPLMTRNRRHYERLERFGLRLL